MVSESRKIILTSLFVGAVAIAAYFSQSDKSWLSSDEFGLERDNGSAHATRADTMTGSVSSGPVAGSGDSTAAVAGDLHAARNSLQQNDLAAAQAQLDAARAAHRDDDQVLALQGEVQARMAQMQRAPASTQGEGLAQQAPKSARASLPASRKTGRTDERHVATPRDASNRVNRPYGYAKARRGSETAVAAASAASTSGGRTSGAGASVFAGPLLSVPAEKVVSNEDSAPAPAPPAPPAAALPSASQAELAAHAAPASAPSSPQFGAAGGTLLKSESGPKTRAQVRAEIANARADGSLPAFGNPDPAGPGGAPSLTIAPRP